MYLYLNLFGMFVMCTYINYILILQNQPGGRSPLLVRPDSEKDRKDSQVRGGAQSPANEMVRKDSQERIDLFPVGLIKYY